ncbi:carbon starvation protein A [Roseiconus nitratireducens]|uniref:Carbon starvation protein A n=1 Tax=Roseiconus nitratireducens TaxID=2605748 RepID=A0A5M6CXL5_9BACT|nr:carbon starvation protein A [Roseiconus nitratireducens]KAA5539843.1 carbon starvation protein A [Roseiconus nitratireducens]
MSTLAVAVLSMVGFLVAYHTYGRWLAKKLFGLTDDYLMPSEECHDGVDFVPTRKSIVFGHHFTSIAGTGPIVGPALAVFWGWLPALLWVVFGSILIGGVHDLSALVISIRNKGQTVGQAAGRLISPRAKLLFLLVLFLALSVVLAVFGLVIASIFAIYPESVLSVWIAMPIAVVIGYRVYHGGGSILVPSMLGLAALYLAVYVGAYYLPVDLKPWLPAESEFWTPTVVWTIVLLIYAFVASVLPVWLLLQPRDYINSLQLFVALALLVVGLGIASVSGRADLGNSAPAIASEVPADAPSMFPFLFITIACGACSGFHCLVSSGTTSKQLQKASDAQAVGYGSMLLEGMLAVLVILACSAGVGMGPLNRSVVSVGEGAAATSVVDIQRGQETGRTAWRQYYRTGADGSPDAGWKKQNLAKKLRAFVDGGANFLSTLGISIRLSIAIMAVLVACFAATTLDTATRLQRYVISELALSMNAKPVANKYVATTIAVGVGLAIAIFAGDSPGTGGLVLWPLFGATNQLLAGLALMVALVFLARRSKPLAAVMLPMFVMLLMPAWAITYDLIYNWIPDGNLVLSAFGMTILGLQAWMVVEGILVWKGCQGVLEKPAELDAQPPTFQDQAAVNV